MNIIMLILGVVLIVFILWLFPHVQVKLSKADITKKESIELKNKLRLTWAQILGGAFILGGLFFTWKSLEVSKEGQITDRFTRAIEQLGDDELQIRLGGIYALDRIAKDSERDHWTIMEILTTYVRDRSPWLDEDRENKKSQLEKNLPSDIQAILKVIRRRAYTDKEEGFINLANTDLSRAVLSRAVLSGADLTAANLYRADFTRANLRGANLSEADLTRAYLDGADLSGSDLSGANLSGADLNGADLSGAYLDEADLTRADFTRANLKKAILSGANLKEAFFTDADLTTANLSRADLGQSTFRGAIFRGSILLDVINLSIEQLSEVKTLYGSKLGLDIEKQVKEKYPHLLEK